jgi:hypothetical protein
MAILPNLCYDGLTGDLIRAWLSDGKDVMTFIESVIGEYQEISQHTALC